MTGVDVAEGTDGDDLDPRFRWVLALLGFGLLVAGCVATFVTTNDVGAASLVAGGFAFAALAYLGDRITRVRYGEFEADIGVVKKAEALVRAASVAEGAGEPERAEDFRAEALETLNQLGSVGRSYEELRRSMPAGWERTQRMEHQVAEARRLAKEKGVDADQVRQLVASGTEGDRLAALGAMEAVPQARDFDLVLGLVSNPRTPFEHYHALLVAKGLVPELDERQQQRLTDTLSRQRTDRRLAKDSDRRILIEDILQETGMQV
jgi:pyruvate/2-oxoglutarate dehydrogenase complex dihydrolipoamide acyltransferase (E2) component